MKRPRGLCRAVRIALVSGSLMAWVASAAPRNPEGAPALATSGSAAEGQGLFANICVVCHGPGASGGRGPALNSGQFSHGVTDLEIFATIRHGVAAGGMPAFGQFTDSDVWSLVKYLRSLSPAEDAASSVSDSDAAVNAGERFYSGAGGCASCHEINGRGRGFAPDLSAIGLRSIADIRAGIEHRLPPHYPGVTLSLVDRTQVTGRLLAGDAVNLLLQDESGQTRVIKRDAVTVEAPYSLIPTQLVGRSDEDLLLSYLVRQRGRAVEGAIKPTSEPLLSAKRLTEAAKEPQNWPTYWGNYDGHHFSLLTQINTSNVGALQAQWATALPGNSPLESTPLVVDGVMYLSGSPGEVYALDAETGLQLWKFSRKQDIVNPYQINPYNRGVAVLGARVFVGTLDNLLIALDARTGRELWERRIAEPLDGYTISGAPLALKNQVVVGVGCGEYGVRGFLESYDTESGKRLWRFDTIPAPGEAGHDTWSGDSWQRGGGGTWLTGSYDPSLDTLYWTVGNPAPFNNWTVRRGDNLYTDSVLALDPNSGKLKWHYQFTPNDSHDWDSAQDVILTDRNLGGKARKLLLHADRNGFLYTLDREKGQFLSARAFVTQTWNDGFSSTGRPLIRASSIATPEGQRVFPTTSATNFQSPSFDEHADKLYLVFRDTEGLARYGTAEYARGKPYTAPSTGPVRNAAAMSTGILALDASSGTKLWTHSLPRFAPQAGVLATAGDLVFAGSAEGSIMALDSNTGATLWHFRAGNQIFASPISYAVRDHQYVALAAGNTVYAFSLPAPR